MEPERTGRGRTRVRHGESSTPLRRSTARSSIRLSSHRRRQCCHGRCSHHRVPRPESPGSPRPGSFACRTSAAAFPGASFSSSAPAAVSDKNSSFSPTHLSFPPVRLVEGHGSLSMAVPVRILPVVGAIGEKTRNDEVSPLLSSQLGCDARVCKERYRTHGHETNPTASPPPRQGLERPWTRGVFHGTIPRADACCRRPARLRRTFGRKGRRRPYGRFYRIPASSSKSSLLFS